MTFLRNRGHESLWIDGEQGTTEHDRIRKHHILIIVDDKRQKQNKFDGSIVNQNKNKTNHSKW